MNTFTKQLVIICAAIFPLACLGNTEKIINTNICEVATSPATFNHELIKLSGIVTHEFGLFTITDDNCKPHLSSIWLEYGGLIATPSVYKQQSTEQTRSTPLVVDGLSTTLVDDSLFKKFDKKVMDLSSPSPFRATLIGRYFAGHEEEPSPGFKIWGGYGRLGCCTMLVIQQVVAVQDK